jgi:hypothetical protein
MTKYGLLGIDVDGTLLGPDHKLRSDAAEAIRDARAAGLRVCLATGRSYVETVGIWRMLDLAGPFEPLVLIGGALVSEPDTGRTLYQRPLPRQLAEEFADALGQAGYAAMAIVDAWRCGWDYILCQAGDVPAAQRHWLDKMHVKVRRVRRLADAPEMPAPLRISVIVDPQEWSELAATIKQKFDGRLNVHVVCAPNYGVTVLEGFSPDADKFSALNYVAQAYRIAPARIAAVGDDVNDLSMIRKAGLGVAMPNSPPAVQAAADLVAAEGLPAFIRRLVAGQFD